MKKGHLLTVAVYPLDISFHFVHKISQTVLHAVSQTTLTSPWSYFLQKLSTHGTNCFVNVQLFSMSLAKLHTFASHPSVRATSGVLPHGRIGEKAKLFAFSPFNKLVGVRGFWCQRWWVFNQITIIRVIAIFKSRVVTATS